MTDRQNPITVTVKSFATLREVMDARVRMEVPHGATIRTLPAELTGRYKRLAGLIFAAPETLRDVASILRNGRNIHFLAGPDTPLDDGNLIAIFPPLAGGQGTP